MKNKVFIRILAVLFILIISGCGEKTPTAPVPPPIPDCEKYNTATVQFENRNASITVDVYWDKIKRVVLGPGTKSQVYKEAAGVHTLQMFVTNTWLPATQEAKPVLIMCEAYLWWCQ